MISHSANKCEESYKVLLVKEEDACCLFTAVTHEVLQTVSKAKVKRCFLGSGCTSHICCDESVFAASTLVKNRKLMLASEACIDVDAKGTAEIIMIVDKSNNVIKLHEPLLVRDLRRNRMPVVKITYKGNTVTFGRTKRKQIVLMIFVMFMN